MNKKKFTNEDWQRLKDDEEAWVVTRDIVNFILARLEAAEDYIGQLETFGDTPETRKYREVWDKTKRSK